MSDAQKFITVPELARRINKHPATVRRWVKSGKIHFIQHGKSIVFDLLRVETDFKINPNNDSNSII